MIGHGLDAAEVGHVYTAGDDDGGDALPGRGLDSVRPCAEDTVADFVGQFGGGHVKAAGDVAVANQVFHCASAAAGGVEDEDFVTFGFQQAAGVVDGGGRVAEHGGGNEGPLVGGGLGFGFHHAGDGAGRIGVDGAAEAVDAGHVDDGGHEGNVFAAGIGANIAAANGGDHHFGHADRQRAHGGSGDRCAAAAAHPENAVETALAIETLDDCGETLCHGPHRFILMRA